MRAAGVVVAVHFEDVVSHFVEQRGVSPGALVVGSGADAQCVLELCLADGDGGALDARAAVPGFARRPDDGDGRQTPEVEEKAVALDPEEGRDDLLIEVQRAGILFGRDADVAEFVGGVGIRVLSNRDAPVPDRCSPGRRSTWCHRCKTCIWGSTGKRWLLPFLLQSLQNY